MSTIPLQEFLRRATEKCADLTHRATIQRNIDSYDVAVAKGKQRFSDWEAARSRCSEIKAEAIAHLDRYLEQFEGKVKERGGHVFWAETAEDARQYIAGLAQSRGVKTIVKSKSMVTEEIHLSGALEKQGAAVWETDLGEYIVQLRNEPPYHIVTPAMHLTRVQIAQTFREKIPSEMNGEEPPQLVAAARRKLRKAFFSAEMGISGANFLVADAGMVAISTNEGNGRLTTTLPRIHVAITGIEKIIPRLSDLATLWPVLATAGTGQPITTYSTLIGGPRQPGETDGPEEFHVVLLDNGRSQVLASREHREMLKCIRCGACLNVCPVYRQIGGHAYGTTYQGPIGSVLTPNLKPSAGFEHLAFASSLCSACGSACPVRINLPHQLLLNRRDAMAKTGQSGSRTMFRLFRWTAMSSVRFRVMGWLSRKGISTAKALGIAGSKLDPMRPWTQYRNGPEVPTQTFREWWRTHGRQ
ncbi:MAG TPA: LutB/LldF family L-lactate oxidation iron-sulfur protein [Terriglobales bacterium]|nr:LutB/LldF family L-lactate oxidation iron-sulfur protein [Terriglobales bacterium]